MDLELVDPQLIEAAAESTMGDAAVASQVGNGGASPISEISPMELYHVELRVLWGDRLRERSARFTSLRLALPDMSQGRTITGGRDDAVARPGRSTPSSAARPGQGKQ